MNFDFVFGVVCSLVAGVLMVFGWSISASTIGQECEKMGHFYIAQKVYECKLKAREQ